MGIRGCAIGSLSELQSESLTRASESGRASSSDTQAEYGIAYIPVRCRVLVPVATRAGGILKSSHFERRVSLWRPAGTASVYPSHTVRRTILIDCTNGGPSEPHANPIRAGKRL